MSLLTYSPGWISLAPPILSIAVALITRHVYFALGLFVWSASCLLSGGDLITGSIASVERMVKVLSDLDNIRILIASTLIGSVVNLAAYYGGGAGLAAWFEARKNAGTPRLARIVTGLVSMSIFLESNFALLVTGSVARPLCDRAKISPEKLSYILDATCAPKQIMIPINAWGAYIVGLLAAQGVASPTGLLWSSLAFNFYAIFALVLAAYVIVIDFNFPTMRAAEDRVRNGGPRVREGSRALVLDELAAPASTATQPRARNLVIPVAVMTAVVPIVLAISGGGSIMAGDGGKAVLWGVLAGTLASMMSLKLQKLATLRESFDVALKGVGAMVPMVLILTLAFAISSLQKELGTGLFLASLAKASMPVAWLPPLIFAIACFVAFSTGTSWGTFAVMIPIVMPMVASMGLHAPLLLAAALGGGIFGDHCSPISDSSLVASMASGCDHVDHVKTQLPYALLAAAFAMVAYFVAGLLFL
jgi:Na+/H+ antiporter NhaC